MGFSGSARIIYGAALALLVLNDWVLKASAALPLLTGKLSDVCGLIVAPLTLCVLIGRRGSPRSHASAFVLTGVTFAAINGSPAASDLLVRTLGLFGLTWRLWPDPTDLWALAVMPLAWRLTRELRNQEAVHFSGFKRSMPVRAPDLLLAWLGAAACIASGDPDIRDADLGFIANTSGISVQLRTSRLKGQRDCSAERLVFEDDVLRAEDFELPGTTDFAPGAAFRLTESYAGNCNPVRIAVWPRGGEEADAVSAVVEFEHGAGRLLNPEPSAEELKNTDGLVLVQRVEGQLKLHLGKGLRRLRLAKGEPVLPGKTCALRPAPRISTYKAYGVLLSIERIGERCYELALSNSSAPAHAPADVGDPQMLDGPVDDGRFDGSPVDGGLFDGGLFDGGPVDGGPVDAGPVDAGLSDGGPFDGGDARASWMPPASSGVQRISVCVELPLPFQVGDKMYIAGDAASGVSIGSGTTRLALRWSEGGDDSTPGSCPQIRDACGAVWLTEEGSVPSTLFAAGRQDRDMAANTEGVHIVNTYRVLLGRDDCPAHLVTPNRRAEWIEVSY